MEDRAIQKAHDDGLVKGGMIARRMIDERDSFMEHMLTRRLQAERAVFAEACIGLVEEHLNRYLALAAEQPARTELFFKLREAAR